MSATEKVINGILHYEINNGWMPYTNQELTAKLADAIKLSEMFIEWGQRDNKNAALDDACIGYLVAGQEFHKLLQGGKSDLLKSYMEDKS